MISKDMAWSDFFEIQDSDGENILIDRRFHVNNWFNGSLEFPVSNFNSYYAKFLSYRDSENNFGWYIHTHFYKWYKSAGNFMDKHSRIRPYPYVDKSKFDPEKHCENEVAPSKIIKQLADDVISKVTKRSESLKDFITLHIRRNDAKSQCKSNKENIEKYLSCSLEFCDGKHAYFPIVLFTDEKEASYIKMVNTTIYGLGMEMVHGDSLVKDILSDKIKRGVVDNRFLNNYVIFQVSNLVKSAGKYKLARHRKQSCRHCDKICG